MKIKKIKKINRSVVFQKGIKVVLSGLMTLILMYVSSNIYHKSPFIEVEFQTSQNKTVTYQIFYTTDPKKPTSFNEKQSVKKNVSAGLHTEHIILPTPKIVQFRFDFGEYPGEVNVLKITLKGKNEQVLNLKDFRFGHIDSQTVQNNQLMLVSKQRDPQIIHQKPIKIEPSYVIDWCFFFGLLCIYGAASYALISYLSAFKISGKRSPFPLIFLCLFFGALFLPMMHISNEEKSVSENRMLAKIPAVTEIFKEKSEYGKAFENWFNDHFFGRDQMMIVHDEIRNKTNEVIRTKDKNEEFIYLKENDWMLSLSFWDINPQQTSLVIQNIKKLNEFCQENNIKLYLLYIPRKEIMYQELLYDYAFDKKQYKRLNEIYETVKKEAQKINVPFVYPLNELREAKQKDYVYFKWTHHWTDWGAYSGYQALMKEVQKDFPDISIVTLNEYNKTQNKLIRDEWNRNYYKGNLERIFNIKKDEANSVNYTYYDHKNKNLLQTKTGQYTKDYSYPLGKYKIMIIGNSVNENLTQFIPYSANELKYIRVNMNPVSTSERWKIMKLYKKDILSFKPDILVLSFVNIHLWNLQFLFNN